MKAKIISILKKHASKEKKLQSERYFKNVVKFYGLRNPEVQSLFRSLWKDISQLSRIGLKTIALYTSQEREAPHKKRHKRYGANNR